MKTVPPQGWMISNSFVRGAFVVRVASMTSMCYSIAPNEVPLVVKDSMDSCNSGKDIYFQLIGFMLQGQVSTVSTANSTRALCLFEVGGCVWS